MRKAQNYSVKFGFFGEVDECDSFTCNHCQKVVFVPVGVSVYDISGGCRICGHLICAKCVKVGVCKPWEEKMQEIEGRYLSDKMYSRLVGR